MEFYKKILFKKDSVTDTASTIDLLDVPNHKSSQKLPLLSNPEGQNAKMILKKFEWNFKGHFYSVFSMFEGRKA